MENPLAPRRCFSMILQRIDKNSIENLVDSTEAIEFIACVPSIFYVVLLKYNGIVSSPLRLRKAVFALFRHTKALKEKPLILLNSFCISITKCSRATDAPAHCRKSFHCGKFSAICEKHARMASTHFLNGICCAQHTATPL